MDLEKKIKKSNIQKVILETVKLAGVVSIGVIASNVLGAMKRMGFITHPRQTESIKRSRDRLIEKGLLEDKNGQLKITREGKRYLFRCLSLGDNRELNKNKKWDGKWRVIVFDIPETGGLIEQIFARLLFQLGL